MQGCLCQLYRHYKIRNNFTSLGESFAQAHLSGTMLYGLLAVSINPDTIRQKRICVKKLVMLNNNL